eukprot:918718_1
MAYEGDMVNHYKVAIESVKMLEESMVDLGAHKGYSASQKLNDIIRIWNRKMRRPFPALLQKDIKRILSIRNAISHKPNCHTIPDCYEFITKIAAIKVGFVLIRESFERNTPQFEKALAQTLSITFELGPIQNDKLTQMNPSRGSPLHHVHTRRNNVEEHTLDLEEVRRDSKTKKTTPRQTTQ